MKIINLIGICLLLFIPLTYSDNSSGGGGGAVYLYTYEECNEVLNNKIQEYEKATINYEKVAEKYVRITRKISLWVIGILLLSSIYLLISLGMTIQKIKYLGFKKWWKNK
jgi:hypothetical protein